MCRGNVDVTDPTDANPEARLLHISGWTILMLHILGTPHKANPAAAKLIQEHAPDIVVFGHSHKVCVVQHDGILFVNPGSAGMLCCQAYAACALQPADGHWAVAAAIHALVCALYMLLVLLCRWKHVPTEHQMCICCCLGILEMCQVACDMRLAAATRQLFKEGVHSMLQS